MTYNVLRKQYLTKAYQKKNRLRDILEIDLFNFWMIKIKNISHSLLRTE
jgi:hypothetical protein